METATTSSKSLLYSKEVIAAKILVKINAQAAVQHRFAFKVSFSPNKISIIKKEQRRGNSNNKYSIKITREKILGCGSSCSNACTVTTTAAPPIVIVLPPQTSSSQCAPACQQSCSNACTSTVCLQQCSNSCNNACNNQCSNNGCTTQTPIIVVQVILISKEKERRIF